MIDIKKLENLSFEEILDVMPSGIVISIESKNKSNDMSFSVDIETRYGEGQGITGTSLFGYKEALLDGLEYLSSAQ